MLFKIRVEVTRWITEDINTLRNRVRNGNEEWKSLPGRCSKIPQFKRLDSKHSLLWDYRLVPFKIKTVGTRKDLFAQDV